MRSITSATLRRRPIQNRITPHRIPLFPIHILVRNAAPHGVVASCGLIVEASVYPSSALKLRAARQQVLLPGGLKHHRWGADDILNRFGRSEERRVGKE